MHKMPNLEADWLQQQRRSTLGDTPASRGQECEATFLFSSPKQQKTGGKRFKIGF